MTSAQDLAVNFSGREIVWGHCKKVTLSLAGVRSQKGTGTGLQTGNGVMCGDGEAREKNACPLTYVCVCRARGIRSSIWNMWSFRCLLKRMLQINNK